MPASLRDKAAGRASMYRQEIEAAQAAGDHRKGADLAVQWLRGELAKVRQQRPHDAPAVDVELTKKLMELAEAIPAFRPRRG
ncbi:hypothetical protein [Spirillospora sp. NBC_01491]|uniref:hypothetical protein n=1 Tax=Spirillospora sp. NBC_01491 TaxID=2976007 RepID=UPI002E2FCEEB|nr:hypothetical protein [Spirillospora sp. NBC_01491]